MGQAAKAIRGENPPTREVLSDALPTKAKAKDHEAMPYADLPAFMVRCATVTACRHFAWSSPS